ncbi:hypothetical protein BURPSS13_C0123 [Burkholderia pseudomallei S13]|nr:hypothetical protein BURPSS13_C0123 [Burkholderia pseudomallei S13]
MLPSKNCQPPIVLPFTGTSLPPWLNAKCTCGPVVCPPHGRPLPTRPRYWP